MAVTAAVDVVMICSFMAVSQSWGAVQFMMAVCLHSGMHLLPIRFCPPTACSVTWSCQFELFCVYPCHSAGDVWLAPASSFAVSNSGMVWSLDDHLVVSLDHSLHGLSGIISLVSASVGLVMISGCGVVGHGVLGRMKREQAFSVWYVCASTLHVFKPEQ